MNRHYRGSMDDCGLGGEPEFLKGAAVQDRIRELLEKARRTKVKTVPIRLGPMTNGDLMKDTGLPAIGSLAGVDVPPMRLGKFQDPFRPAAYGAFGPTGLELDVPRQGFSLLAKKGEAPVRHFRAGQRVKHWPSGVIATFLKDNGDGTARVEYSERDQADHDLAELCAGDEGSSSKSSSASLAKRARAAFKVGDNVTMQDGDQGHVEGFSVGGELAHIRTARGTALVLTKSLRAAGAMGKSTPMPEGSPVWVRLPGSSREVRASIISCNADEMVVQFADGTQSVITPEQARAIDQTMLQDPMTVINREGRQYRLMPNGQSGLIQAPKAAGGFSLLKGVRPFVPATSVSAGRGDGDMSDAGL